MGDAGSGSGKLAPKFSPALAVQKHGTGPVLVSLRAGEGDGPWWLAIQRGFGPLYIEQVGFGVTVRQDQLERISLLLDGRVSLFGLTAAVDDLQLTFVVASNASIFDPTRWAVDLGGLAISSDLGGILLAGGPAQVRLGRQRPVRRHARGAVRRLRAVGVRRLRPGRRRRTALRVVLRLRRGQRADRRAACVLRHRHRRRPRDQPRRLSCRATCRSSTSTRSSRRSTRRRGRATTRWRSCSGCRDFFPMRRGSFWFAAGLSFTSFALVDGVVVVSVEVGDGVQIALLRPRSNGAAEAAVRARLDRARSRRALLDEGGRALGPGAADRQLVAALSGRPAHRRLRVRDLVRRAEPRPVRAHDRRLPPELPPRRLPGGAAARAAVAPRTVHLGQGRVVLRAHVRGRDGRRPARGLGRVRARHGRMSCSAPTASSTTTRSASRSRSTPASRPA